MGKISGVYLVGAAQMFILILASTLLFGLRRGDPLGVLVLVLAAAVGAAGRGLLLAAIAKTPAQAAPLLGRQPGGACPGQREVPPQVKVSWGGA